ncbi:uncharacterized protein LOC143150740 [Ptiloglossa arizonensis]|uniref:uncharacterized protein LOC143150740 n=1 Tax=Ptiloglossa arizonensis TaxID=3350558 RepID=UPI003FA0D06C
MDMFICNKCFTTTQRGKKPFYLTQCGHVYCNGCIQLADRQCPECQQVGVYSVKLQPPSLSKVEHFFVPLTESLETLKKIYGFQNNQVKLMIQRFYEIDKKYEVLKLHYYNLTQNMKVLKDKYMKLKMENADLRKKLTSVEIHNKTLHSNNITTPRNSTNTRNNGRNTKKLYLTSSGTNVSSKSFNVENESIMSEGFRIPSLQSLKLSGPSGASNTRSTYTFMI